MQLIKAFLLKFVMYIKSTLLISAICFTILIACVGKSEQNSLTAKNAKEEINVIDEDLWVEIDSSMSIVTWIGSKPTGQHNGTIGISKGQIALKNSEVIGGNFDIDMTSIKVMDLTGDKNKRLRDHLVSEDFFQVDSFPISTFTLTSLANYDALLLPSDKEEFHSDFKPASLSQFIIKDPTHLISGNLELKGVTKNISIPVRIEYNLKKIIIEGKFNIDRTDWDISHSNEASVLDKAKDKFIYNTVNVGMYMEVPLLESSPESDSLQNIN